MFEKLNLNNAEKMVLYKGMYSNSIDKPIISEVYSLLYTNEMKRMLNFRRLPKTNNR
jgi:lysine/ornithine N-monooxygenase